MGALLQTNVDGQPTFVSPLLHQFQDCTWDAWKYLPQVVAGTLTAPMGGPFEVAHGEHVFDYFSAHPEHSKHQRDYMASICKREEAIILKTIPFADFVNKTLLDVGGGTGSMMGAVKSKFPDINCVTFDKPNVIESVTNPPEGVQMVAGDMYKAGDMPKADIILLKHILHNWCDEECNRILSSCKSALNENGKIFIIDCTLPNAGENTSDPNDKRRELILDVRMMLIGGKERSYDEWYALAESTNLNVSEVLVSSQPTVQVIVME